MRNTLVPGVLSIEWDSAAFPECNPPLPPDSRGAIMAAMAGAAKPLSVARDYGSEGCLD